MSVEGSKTREALDRMPPTDSKKDGYSKLLFGAYARTTVRAFSAVTRSRIELTLLENNLGVISSFCDLDPCDLRGFL